jgi:hypothetical protein
VNLNSVSSGLLDESLSSLGVVRNVVLDLDLGEGTGLGSTLERDVGRRNDLSAGNLRLEDLRVGSATESPKLSDEEGLLAVDLQRKGVRNVSEVK